ncbi:hypothetical protein LO772_09470 [Yinghuangia sp. ASG 101]|uniref:hypothetical protein n=1 Tax=Yinghuangia sp. ASG 101 TaxID=2896848 RepID=UPI001E5586B1|nr:hypothetical protein [Yinghuangia sp. ASG 101]UGQ13793.1 hypothetical protein LO772_09470 [Yinghuangia sp. ASG 101]
MSRDASKAVRRAGAGWGVARVALGVAAIAVPPVVSRPWIGRDTSTGATVFARALGVRDIALGAGTAVSARTGRGFTTWALASAAADAGDTLITRHHWPELPRTRVAIAGLAGASAVAGVALAVGEALVCRGNRRAAEGSS